MLNSASPSKTNYELALAANPLSNRPIFQSNDIGGGGVAGGANRRQHRLQVLNSRHHMATCVNGNELWIFRPFL